ncbi:MAG: efflux transporter outer membrane subunit [Pirellulales bacterium]|nr:efflux transporter outer membrane subunit [Pirellulales bacterium]
MSHSVKNQLADWLFRGAVLTLIIAAAGCTPMRDYLAGGFKVGPDYQPPPARVAPDWIDAADADVKSQPVDLARWWSVFRDPVLDALVTTSVRQNLTLREAGCRVLQARAARAIAAGNLFPQQQQAVGAFGRNALSTAAANTQFLSQTFYDQWDAGFNLAWELDFWGRFRRAIEAADAELAASVADYDQVTVTLLGDIAATYVEIRTLQERIALAQANVKLQRETYTIADARFRGGQVSELDVDQATSTLAQTEALIPQLELQRREASNRLCVLLGIPPTDLDAVLGAGPIPSTPTQVVVGIPADLLCRRPDLRRAERQVAAESARVGIATAELYPHIGITGTLAYSAENFRDLFDSAAFQGTVGPSFRWNILNYGRLINAVRLQDARLAERIVAYQNLALRANAEAENGITRFLRGRQRAQALARSVDASQRAVRVALAQYRGGIIDFNWVAIVEKNLVDQQELLAQAQGETTLGLVQIYRALGGGWESFHQAPCVAAVGATSPAASATDPTGLPIPEPLPAPEAEPATTAQPVQAASQTTWNPTAGLPVFRAPQSVNSQPAAGPEL